MFPRVRLKKYKGTSFDLTTLPYRCTLTKRTFGRGFTRPWLYLARRQNTIPRPLILYIPHIKRLITLLISVVPWLLPSPVVAKHLPITTTYPHLHPQRVPFVAPTLPYVPFKEVAIAPKRALARTYTQKRQYTGRNGNNCVATVRAAGYYLPRSRNGFAGTIPTNARSIEEGQVAVAITREGPVGHALVVKKVGGKLISIVEGNFPNGVGRTVPPSVIIGFII